MSVLVVVAHPDDEVMGCGATIATITKRGVPARACILAAEADARQNRPTLSEFFAQIQRAQSILGLGRPILGSFQNIRLNTVAQLELVQFIECAMIETAADVIFTHHPHDLNNDHVQTSLACQSAARLFQRQPSIVPPLKGLYYMEVLSSTDWAFPSSGGQFCPDTFFPVSNTLDLKIAALHTYHGVMRPFPHPRSEEVLRALAAYRGGQAGMACAEAFSTAFHALGALDRWQ